MNDLINRQAAIGAIDAQTLTMYQNVKKGATYPKKEWFGGMANACEIIKALPSAEPKYGKWIPVRSYEAFGGDEMMWAVRGNPIAYYYCSNCRNDAYAGEDGESLLTKYCPNCGSRMNV